jgi:hypothetical protein
MDISEFDSADINVIVARIGVRAVRLNKDSRRVLIRAFTGGCWADGEQGAPLKSAVSRVISLYKARGIRVIFQKFNNDDVKTTYKWTCRDLINSLLEADIHLVTTHLHQGMLAMGGTGTFNIPEILSQLQRLRFHLGIPSGIYADDCIALQDKIILYDALAKDGLCAPTISVDITKSFVSIRDTIKIRK